MGSVCVEERGEGLQFVRRTRTASASSSIWPRSSKQSSEDDAVGLCWLPARHPPKGLGSAIAHDEVQQHWIRASENDSGNTAVPPPILHKVWCPVSAASHFASEIRKHHHHCSWLILFRIPFHEKEQCRVCVSSFKQIIALIFCRKNNFKNHI